tara:strand:- start:220 stop:603 length:384 start_codon:yes stop_codon:yes gene_type:complete
MDKDLMKDMQELLEKYLGKSCGTIEYVGEEEGYWIEVLGMGLEPTEIEQKTIARTTLVPGWQPTIAKVEYNYPHAPDDIDVCDFGESFRRLDCAFAFLMGEWVRGEVENELYNAGMCREWDKENVTT